MDKVNQIIFNGNEYASENEMFVDIGIVMQILTKNGYIISFRCEDYGIYVLEFDHDWPNSSRYQLMWVRDEDPYRDEEAEEYAF